MQMFNTIGESDHEVSLQLVSINSHDMFILIVAVNVGKLRSTSTALTQ